VVHELFRITDNSMKKNIFIIENQYITTLDLKTQLVLKGQYGFEIVDSGEEA
jgi:hypothetical protein